MSRASLAVSPPRPPLTRAGYDRYLPLVRRIALSMSRRLPRSIALSDLVAYGWLGLMEAHERGSAVPESEFDTYASCRVRGAILDHLRAVDPSPRRVRRRLRCVERTIRSLTATLGRPPVETEIASTLGMSVEEYQRLSTSDAGHPRLALADSAYVDEVSSEAELPDELTAKKVAVERMTMAVDSLSPRLRRVLALYYGDDRTLRQIGDTFGVTESRVSQMHGEAVRRIRSLLAS